MKGYIAILLISLSLVSFSDQHTERYEMLRKDGDRILRRFDLARIEKVTDKTNITWKIVQRDSWQSAVNDALVTTCVCRIARKGMQKKVYAVTVYYDAGFFANFNCAEGRIGTVEEYGLKAGDFKIYTAGETGDLSTFAEVRNWRSVGAMRLYEKNVYIRDLSLAPSEK